MPFIVKKESDHGISNPIVARLTVQTSNLMEFYSLNEGQRKEILEIYLQKLQPRLLHCHEIKEWLLSEQLKIQNAFNREGVCTQSSGRAITIPQIMNLRQNCENFLYNSKSFLRDLAGIFQPLFMQSFTEARYDRIHDWSKERFGEKDNLTSIIKQDHDLWIRRLVAMRNVVEHPGGYSGCLNIHNIDISFDSRPNRFLLVPPTWSLNDEPRVPVLKDFEAFISNLLEFAEDLLVLCLEKSGQKVPVVIVAQIAEEDRDPECPVRLTIRPRNEFIKEPRRNE